MEYIVYYYNKNFGRSRLITLNFVNMHYIILMKYPQKFQYMKMELSNILFIFRRLVYNED